MAYRIEGEQRQVAARQEEEAGGGHCPPIHDRFMAAKNRAMHLRGPGS